MTHHHAARRIAGRHPTGQLICGNVNRAQFVGAVQNHVQSFLIGRERQATVVRARRWRRQKGVVRNIRGRDMSEQPNLRA
jgi:hypothetical protein